MKVLKISWRVILFLLYVLKNFGVEPFVQAWQDAVNQVPLKQIKKNLNQKS